MAHITTTIDSIRGIIKILLDDGQEKQTIELKWCEFDDIGSVGFWTSFSQVPILLTEVAAEQFIRIMLSQLVVSFEIQPGDLTIINHLGESIQDVQFLPPTFIGTEGELLQFITKQDSLRRIFSAYEQTNKLNSEIINLCDYDDVVDDFLSLIQARTSGSFISVNKPNQ